MILRLLNDFFILLIEFCLQKDNKSEFREYEGQEVLCVRAYGLSFFTLGINIRYCYLLLLIAQILFVTIFCISLVDL